MVTVKSNFIGARFFQFSSKMSEDKRKNARTQGRFSDGDKEYSSRRQDKQSSKMPSTDKNKGEKRKAPVVGSRAQNEIDLQYDDESKYSFRNLEPVKKPREIKFTDPVLVLSDTNNGISRLIYDPDFMKLVEADKYFEVLEDTTAWYDKNIVIRGVEYPQPRLVAWYGPHPYTYAGATLEAGEMPNAVREIKEKVEATLRQYDIKVELNSVLLNLYRNEKDSVAWHSDDELALGICPTIASVSLGVTRRFEMRPKENVRDLDTGDIVYVNLTHGSLIVMDGCMQKDWLHRVPKEYHDKGPRINLTFRTIYPLDQLPPEMPHVSNMKSVKSPSGKVVHQQDPKFDAESFPPLGMEASDKKTKLLPKENGNKDYQQSAIQRKSPKSYWGASDKKTKFLSKGNSDKGYEKSGIQRKSQKEENWDDEMLQGVEDTPTIQNDLNKKSSLDPTNSSELHPSQIDLNSNIKESVKLCDMQFPSSDFIKSEDYSDNSETYQSQNYEPTNSHLFEFKDPSLSESKPAETEVESVDFYSNVEDSAKLCNMQFPSSDFRKSEFYSDNSEAYQYNYETTDNHLLDSKDPSPSEREPNEIKAEPIEIDVKISDSGKKYRLNANAPDFIPQNKFENYSLSELADLCKQLKNEELHSFKEVIFNRAYAKDSPLLPRDFYEFDVYCKLAEDGSLNDKHLKIILERIGSMVKNAFYKQNDPRYTNRYPSRSFDENNHHKRKQSYGRSYRY
ncbi:Alpha-ketoglutarate-dependent dioxygenase alkB 3 [Araneus ventricosus]|uniref:Alpha-ketoglutarate-dependent dioxygenase alkB 3 n=1 Tax=Araneus ventricosus TaxID=182803 RepID=A0A4Y2FK10_ARAVE|nr:Alpha-ketoglutarate-dependent dioxygenase alkB 3 [Araneus ventricosus]